MTLSPAAYRALADAVVVLHFGFVLFVVLGGVLVLRRPWLAWAHLPAAVWGALIEFAGWVCPLTPLENHLRALGREPGYTGGFVEHYITAVLYPSGLTRGMQVAIGLFVLAVNAFVYGTL
ncbi:MAG TPA: DUF2784 domain-containing protein, partial [Longimicrobiaceae bacterium]|nr:DUF2784 domain-containing protein [Longimicrobiaceae bacterium]